ncbi:MAG: YcxB family protein [Treponemataceae bacterium]
MVQIDTTLTPASFTDFSNFNSFSLRRRGLALALFPAAMVGMGIVHRLTGSELLFRVFAGLGIIIPLAYIVFYFIALRGQIKANKLETPRVAYSVAVDESGIAVSTAREQARYPWARIHRAYLTPKYAYLYITPARAFILPYDCVRSGDADELRTLIRGGLEKARVIAVK